MAASGGSWKNGAFKPKSSGPRVMDFETFAAQNGAGALSDDVAIQRMPRASVNDKKRIMREWSQRENVRIAKRNNLRREYDAAVQRGEVRATTHDERLIRTARGHSDNESVQAARRALAKRGIQW